MELRRQGRPPAPRTAVRRVLGEGDGRLASIADELYLPEATNLIEEGRKGRELFVLVDGTVEARRSGRKLREMGAGEFSGEIAPITNAPHSHGYTDDPRTRLGRMTFEVDAEGYDRFMGRYSTQLAPQLADLGGVRAGQRALDVGCGPGALTAELVRRVGDSAVSAVDPSETFVAAARARYPGVDVKRGSAENLSFEADSFDATFAQLVVHFMADPVAGLREMKRVTTAGGVVAVSVWDHAGDRTPLAAFWRAARELDPDVHDESGLAGAREGHLAELLGAAGLTSITETTLTASARFPGFDEWWQPFTLGIGPAGAYLQELDERGREDLRALCERLSPTAPFTIDTVAWAARGTA